MQENILYRVNRFFFFTICFLWVFNVSGQVTIKGIVNNTRGAGIPGISVILKGTLTGTNTETNGTYSISTQLKPGQYNLIFSGIGFMTREMSISIDTSAYYILNTEMNVDALKMDEIVVTGNQVNTSKRKLGNSISTINSEDIKHTGTHHLSEVLNGRIMGGFITQNSGDPGGGFSFKLRGVGSIFGSSEPLYLVDGIVVDNSSKNMVNLNMNPAFNYQSGNNRLIDINPRDVERIEVINGPAAAVIYGSRAANGVVQIFTNKGKKGKPQVVFTTSINLNSLQKKIPVNEYPFRFGIPRDTLRFTDTADRRTMVNNWRTDQNIKPAGGPLGLTGYLDTAKYPVNRYDYQDQLFQPSWGTDQHLSVSGGGDKSTYYMSGSYLDNGGILKGTRFTRYGLNIKAESQLNDWIKMGGGILYANSKSIEQPNSVLQFSSLGAMNHTDNVYDIDERDSAGNLKAVEWSWMNPLTPLETYELSVETNRSVADLHVSLTPWKGFTFSGLLGLDTYAQQGFSYQGRTPYNASLGLFSDGYVSVTKLNYLQWTGDISASYARDLGKKFNSVTVAGFSGQYFRNVFQAQEGRNLLPYVRTINAAQNFFSAPVDQRSEQNVYGYFLQETLGYNNYLFLTLAGRFDHSSAFGADAGRIFYPKAGISFNLSELDFWKNGSIHRWFNTLHLRASYGKAGNLTGIGPYDRFNTYLPVNYYTVGFAPQNRRGNESIRPEVKTEWEGGADMEFLQGRLFARITGYNQQIEDIVLPFNWAPSNGSYSILGNLGNMENKGIEFMAGGFPVKTKNFSWELSILFNSNRNKITRLYQNAPFIGFNSGNTQGALLGNPAGVYYGVYYARNPDGSLLLNTVYGKDGVTKFLLPQVERVGRKNGQPDGTPVLKVLGDPNPDYNATLVNQFRYKNWSLRIMIDRVAGFEVFNYTKIIRNNIGNGKVAEKELKGELSRGWVAAVGGLINGPVIAEEAVEDGSFTKLREMSLSYQLTDLKWINSLEFILTGRNLFTLTPYSGYDPETSTAGQSIVRGTDYFTVPIPRVIQFSLIFSFK